MAAALAGDEEPNALWESGLLLWETDDSAAAASLCGALMQMWKPTRSLDPLTDVITDLETYVSIFEAHPDTSGWTLPSTQQLGRPQMKLRFPGISNLKALARKTLAFDPTFGEGNFILGLALEDSGRKEEALAAYERTLRDEEWDIFAIPGAVRCNLWLGRTDRCRQLLVRADEWSDAMDCTT